MTEEEIRNQLASDLLTPEVALRLVDEVLPASPSPSLWTLRGDLIQLAENTSYELAEAARSYEEAHRLAPGDPDPLEALGYFYDAVMDDRFAAEGYYRAALAKGAGKDCAKALADLLTKPKWDAKPKI